MRKIIKKERVIIFIDGSNFYHRLKEPEVNIKNQLQFDFKSFANWLSRKRKIVQMNYYVGRVRAKPSNKKAMKLMSNQQRLSAKFRDQGWKMYFGYLLKSNKKYHEKGVDVKIAVDLLVGAYENKYDTAILVSSDTDLIPAISKVKELGKKIEYIGFSHKPSFAMQKHVTLSRLLIRDEILSFVVKKNK